ncbi:MAG: RHS repeat-associated core domain-containing protein, partial [Acidobacteriota bacterium]
ANITGAINPPGLWTTTSYDDLNRALSITATDGALTSTVYSGNQVTVTDAAGKSRQSVTDGLGRLTQVIEDPGSSPHLNYATDYTYDVLGNLTIVNQGGQQRFFFYDSLSRLVRAKNPEQDANPSLAISPAPTYNNSWSLGYTYDANGNLLTGTDARGVVTTYAYDDINRSTTITYSDGTPSVERHYDGATNGKGRFHFNYSGGDFSNGANVEHTVVDSYDVLGRPLTGRQAFKTNGTWSQDFTSSRTYDLAGHILSQRYPAAPDRIVNYAYGTDGRLSSFSGNLGGTQRTYADSFTYAPSGQMWHERLGTLTPLYHQMEYNDRLQAKDIRLGTSAGSSQIESSWDRGRISLVWGVTAATNNGNLTVQAVSIPVGSVFASLISSYTYDELNRVKSVTETENPNSASNPIQIASQTFSYDRWGNRTSVVGTVNSQSWDATEAAATNRLKLTAGNQCSGVKNGLCYDAAGNVIFDNQLGASGDRVYDAENRMTSAAGTNGANSYTYDADGRRTRRQVGSQQYWQVYGLGGELVAEYLWNGTTATLQKEYGSGGGADIIAESATVVRWLVKDHLGTPRIIADQTGSLAGITRHDYLPFGEENFAGSVRAGNGYQEEGVRQQFTGYEHDTETDLDFAEARYCSTKQGRFTSPDPLMASADFTDPQSWNRYSYVGNRPTTVTDPSGLLWYRAKGSGSLGQPVWFDSDPGEGWEQIATYDLIYHSAEGWVRLDPNRNRVSKGFATRYDALQGNAVDAFYDLVDGFASGVPRIPSEFAREVRHYWNRPDQFLRDGELTLVAMGGIVPMGGIGRVAAAENETTSLFRAVMQKELDD